MNIGIIRIGAEVRARNILVGKGLLQRRRLELTAEKNVSLRYRVFGEGEKS